MRPVDELLTDAGFLIAAVVAATVGGLGLVLWAFVPAEGTAGLDAALALAAGVTALAALGAGGAALRRPLGDVAVPATPEAG
jgi:hypothetical protein